MTAVALAATLLLVGATGAWAAFVTEGSPYTVGDDPLSLNTGDFNGDGRPDVATINGTASNVSVFLRQAGGGFAQEAGSPISVGASSGPSGAAVGDYNGDGRLDLAVSTFGAGTVAVLLRQPAGGFAIEGGTPFSPGFGSLHAVAAGDFNSDGRLDLAVTSAGGQLVLLPRNPTNTGFSVGPSFPTGTTPVAIAVGDYNGDGLTDLAIANRGSDNVTVLRRSGGTFVAEAARSVGDDPIGIVAADFDGNGRDDFAVTNAAISRVSAFLRSAANTGFTAEAPIAVSTTPVGIDAGDFDRDGRPDLAVATNSGTVDVLQRNAAGGFTRSQTISFAGAANDVEAADFNGDSRPDLAASSYPSAATPDTFSAFLNPAPVAPPQPDAGPAGRRQVRQCGAGVRHREDQAAGTQEVRDADRRGAHPDRQHDRHAPRADRDHRRPGQGQDEDDGLLRRAVQAHPDEGQEAAHDAAADRAAQLPAGQGHHRCARKRRSAGSGVTARAASAHAASTVRLRSSAPSTWSRTAAARR